MVVIENMFMWRALNVNKFPVYSLSVIDRSFDLLFAHF